MRFITIILSGVILLFFACTKNDDIPGTASLTIFNAIVGSDTLVTNFSGAREIQWYKRAGQLVYGRYTNDILDDVLRNHFDSYSGLQQIQFFQYRDTFVHSTPVVNVTVDLPVSSINGLFLTGTVNAPDTMFVRDYLPYHSVADSIMGLRFVNLSPSGVNFSINLQGESNGSEIGELGYKTITPFKNYDVNTNVSAYTFEIRDASNGDSLTTYTMDVSDQYDGINYSNKKRNFNFTLAIYGMPGSTGTDQLAVQLLNNN